MKVSKLISVGEEEEEKYSRISENEKQEINHYLLENQFARPFQSI